MIEHLSRAGGNPRDEAYYGLGVSSRSLRPPAPPIAKHFAGSAILKPWL